MILGGSGGDIIRSDGVLGGDIIRGVHSMFTICSVSDISIIFGVIVSKESCLMSSRVRREDVVSARGRTRCSVSGRSQRDSEWTVPSKITDDVRRCVFEDDNDNSSLDNTRGLLLILFICSSFVALWGSLAGIK